MNIRTSRRLVVISWAALSAAASFAQQPAVSADVPQRLERAAMGDGFLVPLHTAEADEGVPYGVWAAGPRFKASFHEGATLVPYLGEAYPHNLPVAWRTTSVRVGAHELVTREPELSYSGLRAEYDLGAVVEAYDVREHGIEQSFVLMHRPVGSGDLVVQGQVSTMLHAAAVAAAHQALDFCDDQGKPLVRYGAATAVDARGRRQPMTTSYEDGTVTLRLDAAWLAGATFPLTVDPLLGPGALVTGAPRAEVDILRESQNTSEAIWIAYSTVVSASDKDVYVRRWNDDGTLGSLAYTDLTASWSTSDPHGAFVEEGQQVFVVFDRYFPTSQRRYLRYHQHDRADLTTGTSFGTIAATDNAWRADIGGAGSNLLTQALVVWQQEPNSQGPFQNAVTSAIYGCHLDALTGVASPPFAIADTPFSDHERPSVSQYASTSLSGWLVAYQTIGAIVGGSDDWDVFVKQVRLGGSMSSALAIDGASPDHKMAPVVDGFVDRYTVVFTSSTLARQPGKPTGINGHQIRAVRVEWPLFDPIGTTPHPTVVVQSNADPRLEVAGFAYDRDGPRLWTLVFRSTASEILYLRTLGYTGNQLRALTLLNPATGDVSVGGGAAYDSENDRVLLGYGVNGTPNYTTFDGYVHPSVPGWTTTGPSCSTASIQWMHSQLVGTEGSRVWVFGASTTTLHLLVMATASASFQFSGLPPFIDGCWLLLPNAGPDFYGIVHVDFGSSFSWPLPLPEFLDDMTLYFQDFHTDDSGTFSLLSTRRLNVPIGR